MASVLALAVVVVSGAPGQAPAEPAHVAATTEAAEATEGPTPHQVGWASREDVLWVAQTVAALGVAGVAGAVVAAPAAASMVIILTVGFEANSPLPVFATGLAFWGAMVVMQAVCAGVVVWLLALASQALQPATVIPTGWLKPPRDPGWAQRALRSTAGLAMVRPVLGFLAGALLGAGTGLALAAPLGVVALALREQQVTRGGWVPVGLTAATAMVASMLMGQLVGGALGAATAHHLTKEKIPTETEPQTDDDGQR